MDVLVKLVNSVHHLPDGRLKFLRKNVLREFRLQIKEFLIRMFWPVHHNFIRTCPEGKNENLLSLLPGAYKI